MNTRRFREDINGLRAIAVIAVVLFHFGVPGFTGGFIGVDVFFVISGFLMTAIIVTGFDEASSKIKPFSFTSFYLARARRIIPALLFLSLFLAFIGWFLLAPDDYQRTTREIERALLFVSNGYFYNRSGYFATEAHEHLLLHTWSLSVEWQFYIIYPIVIAALIKISRHLLPTLLVVLLGLSFAVSVFKSYSDASYAFYQLPSRAWEMLLGGIVFFLPALKGKTSRLCLHALGLVFICFATFYYSSNTRWPGIAALLPTLGAAFVIYASIESVATNNILFKKIGVWSYSIYLWHWPLVVALLYLGVSGDKLAIIAALVGSLLLAVFSFYVVEDPLRKYLAHKSKVLVTAIMLLSIALLLSFGEFVRKSKGFPDRVPVEVREILAEENNKYMELENCHKKTALKEACVYGTGDVGAVVIGDSHAMSLMKSVVDAATTRNKSVVDLTSPACPPINKLRSINGETELCVGLMEAKLSKLKEYSNIPIFFASRYASVLHGPNEVKGAVTPTIYVDKKHASFSNSYVEEISNAYFDTVCSLTKSNPVAIFRPIPELKVSVPKTMARGLMYRGELERVSISYEEYMNRNKAANELIDKLEKECDVYVIDAADKLCDQSMCYGDISGIPVYFDDDHLNVKGANLFNEDVEAALKAVQKTDDTSESE